MNKAFLKKMLKSQLLDSMGMWESTGWKPIIQSYDISLHFIFKHTKLKHVYGRRPKDCVAGCVSCRPTMLLKS